MGDKRAALRKQAAEAGIKHIVGFSGGIDSQACARWVLNHYPAENVILINANKAGEGR